MLLLPIATTSSRTCTKPTVVRSLCCPPTKPNSKIPPCLCHNNMSQPLQCKNLRCNNHLQFVNMLCLHFLRLVLLQLARHRHTLFYKPCQLFYILSKVSAPKNSFLLSLECKKSSLVCRFQKFEKTQWVKCQLLNHCKKNQMIFLFLAWMSIQSFRVCQ